MKITKYLHHAKKDKNGLVPIYFILTANGWQHRFSTGEKLLPADFREGLATKKQPGYALINSKINSLYTLPHRSGSI